jgi:DNA invertase Pin-like site-specific DNA recombinase
LSAVAKLERATILVRSAEGRARAKQRGMRLGRKPKLNSAQLVEDQGDARQRSRHEGNWRDTGGLFGASCRDSRVTGNRGYPVLPTS